MLRLVSIVACGTRTVIDAVLGSSQTGETTCAARLAGLPGTARSLLL